ncbi:hypothetical protein [Actinoplanes philippinensis]|uniref:hypothetical protein n=1 Tax=Actinoplanes philippinensis TaxID=35752 RepID=UPI0033CEC27D
MGIFENVRVLAKIGVDDVSPLLITAINQMTAEWRLITDSGMRNEPIVLIRDASASPPDGVRLLISGSPAPYHGLSESDVADNRDLFTESDVVFVDGYSLLSEASNLAVSKAIETARSAGTRVCVDAVPHDIDKRIGGFAVLEFLKKGDVAIIEARTLCRIMGITPPSPLNDEFLSTLVVKIDESKIKDKILILRYGEGDISRTAIYRPSQKLVRYDTGYLEADQKAGYGDLLAAREIADIMTSDDRQISE